MKITIDRPGVYELKFAEPLPAPDQPKPRYPAGKGMYIWQVQRCQGGNIPVIVQVALSAGFKWLAIKVQNGPYDYNALFTESLVANLQLVGIDVWGWGYNFALKPRDEARKAAERVKALKLSGYMIDAEGEYKNKPAQTREFCDTLRRDLPDHPIGLASYRYPDLHNEIDWDTFTAICDFHNPQLYWMGTSLTVSPGNQLKKSVAQLKARRDLPVIPIGVASPNDSGTWTPTVAQIQNFHATVQELNLPGFCYWSWQHAERVPEWWATIAAQS